jgi:DNA mismatch repair ATPase MutS
LDLFGRGSLFNLLSTARTHGGEECLASWLKEPAAADVIRDRNAAISELREKQDFREDMALLADYVEHRGDLSKLTQWAAGKAQPFPGYCRAIAWTLGGLNALALAGYWYFNTGLIPIYVGLVISQAFRWRLRKGIGPAHKFIAKAQKELELIKILLERIEREPFKSEPMLQLKARLSGGRKPAYAQIARLETLAGWQDAHKNLVVAGISAILLLSLHLAFAIEEWRLESGPLIGNWVDAVSEMEALCSLATFSHEHPVFPFPELVEGGPCFVGAGLIHPLIPTTGAVSNDISIGDPVRLFIVSGSNMSGKSTLLRTIGVNVVLALAGAPVCARSLKLTSLSIGASIQTTDSLQAGVSRFYAEITRLKQITDIATSNPPALFLLDEILHGTNSHDRRIGAEAVVKSLLGKGAIGLMTTHDLALSRITEDESLSAANVHFQDEMVDGKMVFDYRLRSGVVEHSNAIELMRAVGLDV